MVFFAYKNEHSYLSRAIYTCMAVACLLNIITPELSCGVAEYILRWPLSAFKKKEKKNDFVPS